MTDLEKLADLLFAKFKTEIATEVSKAIEGTKNPNLRQPLSGWLDEYFKIILGRKYVSSTVANHKANIAHVRRIWGEQEIGSIKPIHVAEGLKVFLPEKPDTARRVLSELSSAYNLAIQNDWAEINPTASIKPPPAPVKRKRLSMALWQKLYVAAKDHRQKWLAPLLLLGLITGQRRADLGKMRFYDIKDGFLYVEQQKKAGKLYGARVAIPLALRLDSINMSLGDVVDVCSKYGKPGATLIRKNNGKEIELSSLTARFSELIVSVCEPGEYESGERPSLHELRSLSEREHRKQGIHTQHLLGHKTQDMTDKYNDDRGLSEKEYQFVACVE